MPRRLKLVLLLLLVIAVSVVATALYLAPGAGHALLARLGLADPASAASATAGAVRPQPAPDPIFAALDPFTVSLQGESRRHVLYAGVTLRLADQDSRKIIQDYMPEVRDRALSTLADAEILHEPTAAGQKRLAEDLRKALSQPYAPLPHGPRISTVLFTAFVVQ